MDDEVCFSVKAAFCNNLREKVKVAFSGITFDKTHFIRYLLFGSRMAKRQP
jgi:hypothetical protein